jgi:CHAT domain-containing protein/tetratricopeptide (TPR) repeat protein
MEAKVSFLIESLNLIAETQGNTERVYAFWQMNIDKIDASLIQIMPNIASQIFETKGEEEREFIARLFGNFGSLIQDFPLGNRGINLELVITSYQVSTSILTRNEYPTTWAGIQTGLGEAYRERIEGVRKENIEQAIHAYRAALEVFTRQDFSLDWADIQTSLGEAYHERIEGVRKENIEQAIHAYRAALEVYTCQTFPFEWARTQHHLGLAYSNRIEGVRKENIEQAIHAYQTSLEVYTRQDFPIHWATTQNGLGAAYSNRIEGVRKENIEQAIHAYQTSLEVFTRQDFPIQRATTQSNLGAAYSNRIEGVRKENIELAIHAYQTSLEVFTRQAFPFEWARTQNNLGGAYANRIEGDFIENIEQAIQTYQTLLEVHTRQAFPFEWARTQSNLGVAYSNRIEGVRKENIELAIHAYQASLEVFTRQAFPFEWATTQNGLGVAYSNRIEGDCKVNRELAIDALRVSLEVCARQTFPVQWARIQNDLGVAYSNRIEGVRKENIELAIHAYQASLEVFTRQDFPLEWAATQNVLGNAYYNRIEGVRKENIELAIQSYRSSLEVRQVELQPRDGFKAGYNLGDLAFKEGDWHLAIEGFEKAITALEKIRSRAMGHRRRQEILDGFIDIYEKMLQSCIIANRLDLALQTVERVRSKRLVDLMAALDLYPQGEIPEPVRLILDRITNAKQQMDDLRLGVQSSAPELAGAGKRDRAAVAPPTAEIHALEAQKQALIDELSRYDAVSAQLVEISPLDISQIQTELLDRPDVALLSFYTTTQDTHILIVRSASIQCFTCQGQGFEQLQHWLIKEWLIPYLPPPIEESPTPAEKEEWQKEYDDKKLRWPQNMPERLQQLAEKLELDRLVTENLQDVRELILIPHLCLHLIPFAALPLNGTQEYLGDRFLLRYAPGCQVLKFCSDRNELPLQQQYGTVENATEDLPFAAIEGESIAQLFQIEDADRLRGPQQATRDAYKGLLNRVNSVASCHHAQSRLDNPLESALTLANGQRVTLGDLLSPAWRFADLSDVFLSCCETGMTMPQSLTDELLTLGTGFLCAGARSVISSLWSVDDVATALLSQIYHEYRAQKQNRIVALQKAQQDLRCMSGEQLKALSEAEFIPALLAQQEQLEQCRQAARHQQQQSEAQRYGNLIDHIENNVMHLEVLWKESLPFDHPFYWAAFTCQGLR